MKEFVFKVGFTYKGFNSVIHVTTTNFLNAELEVHRMYSFSQEYYCDHSDVEVLFVERVSGFGESDGE